MKKLGTFFLVVSVTAVCFFFMVSCKKTNFLDNTAVENLTEQSTFSDSTRTMGFLNYIYEFMGDDVLPTAKVAGLDYDGFETMTSNAMGGFTGAGTTQPFLQGSFNSTTSSYVIPDYTSTSKGYYFLIRACNIYMQQVKNAPISDSLKKRTTAEARFLRAWYYSELVRLFGGVMLVGDNPLGLDAATSLNYQRNTMKECIDYIIGQCDTATINLPALSQQQSSDYGRITSGAALALKARMLLYAASPLLNGSPISTDAKIEPLICYSATEDPSLWQKAAAAFSAVMNTGQYSLFVDNSTPGHGFKELFLTRPNNEVILPYNVSMTIANLRNPPSFSGQGDEGMCASCPSENLVDKFGMGNGLAISNPNSGYNPQNPYVNRDPRFYSTVIYNQDVIYQYSTSKFNPVNIYDIIDSKGVSSVGSVDAIQRYATQTGYYCAKMTDDSTSGHTTYNEAMPLIRYAEILLGYAEALNETEGATSQVYDLVEQIRNRAGIQPGTNGLYGLQANMTKAQMRAAIQNEDAVEFAFEGHWYYDCRRWEIAEQTETQPFQGMMAVKQSDGSFKYSPFTLFTPMTQQQFRKQMYYMPIPFAELTKSNLMVQNPGW